MSGSNVLQLMAKYDKTKKVKSPTELMADIEKLKAEIAQLKGKK